MISKKRVRKAGEFLAAGSREQPGYDEALEIVNFWRFVHIEMLREALGVLESACGSSYSPILVGRIKRLDTIIEKLRVHPEHNLDRLGDISGARLIVQNDDDARRLSAIIEGFDGMDIKLIHDYIEQPKENGYRGIHLSYKHDSKKYGLSNLQTEVQVRSRRQHLWATAVELFDTVTDIGLKRGRAAPEYVRYFKLASELMADSRVNVEGLREELRSLDDKLRVYDTLNATAGSMYAIDDEAENVCRDNLCVISANFALQTITLDAYDGNRADEAVRRYAELEEGEGTGVYLLARASSSSDLRVAYPNYYANANEFCDWLFKQLS